MVGAWLEEREAERGMAVVMILVEVGQEWVSVVFRAGSHWPIGLPGRQAVPQTANLVERLRWAN